MKCPNVDCEHHCIVKSDTCYECGALDNSPPIEAIKAARDALELQAMTMESGGNFCGEFKNLAVDIGKDSLKLVKQLDAWLKTIGK